MAWNNFFKKLGSTIERGVDVITQGANAALSVRALKDSFDSQRGQVGTTAALAGLDLSGVLANVANTIKASSTPALKTTPKNPIARAAPPPQMMVQSGASRMNLLILVAFGFLVYLAAR